MVLEILIPNKCHANWKCLRTTDNVSLLFRNEGRDGRKVYVVHAVKAFDPL